MKFTYLVDFLLQVVCTFCILSNLAEIAIFNEGPNFSGWTDFKEIKELT